ncbi:hypothetical protein GLOIN_2v1883854 [Rhizophagus clarus]|uniref:SWIM-type domain-containing protein n=1 Tax=Rhizophagus clarus TaxID=94130 RepID=A0A8H3LTM1_9GLOM|nr:hypothetical protein GLOIN_2v1883854 [Rhizophagus clarus]
MESDTSQIFSWDSLPNILKSILPHNYSYLIKIFNELSSYQTAENFKVPQFELDIFVDVDNQEGACEWFKEYESKSKTTMPQTRGYDIKGDRVLFREQRHCIHSHEVKKKQGKNAVTKRPQSLRARDTCCTAAIHLRLNRQRLSHTHPLEINLKYTHNHVINSAESLSFRRVKEEVREELLELFKDGHSPSSALYVYQDKLHLEASDEQELIELLADRSVNPDYDYVAKLFQEYREAVLGSRNGKSMFSRLEEVIKDYNDSGLGNAILQEYDARTGKSFILCIVTGLMSRIHEKVPQAAEICYVDASASFEPLNTSITLLYTSCAIGALPLGLIVTSDELEITLEKAFNMLKTILPPHAFYGCGPQTGPILFLTDDSSAERNALELCFPKTIRLLCTFHILQAFWRWLHDSKHHIKKEDRVSIMTKMKKILYALLSTEMDAFYHEFKQEFYHSYPQLQKHFELLWERRCLWALSYRSGLPTRGNNTNNYVEKSFGILKDIVFARTQAFNSVQVFQFITTNMERFYQRRILGFANKHPGHLQIAKRFLCPGWESVCQNGILETNVMNEFLVQNTSQDSGTFYVVNSEFGTCSCPVGISGAPCKHQGAVSMKFHISMFNFIPSLTLDDRIIYTYIALGYVAKDRSFYASLHAKPAPQSQEIIHSEMAVPNNTLILEIKELSEENKEVDILEFSSFLEEMKLDDQNAGQILRTSLDKFKDRYNAAKSKSIPRLSSFLYDLNRNIDPMARINSGAHIRVQVESVKRRKTQGSSNKRRISVPTRNEKENLDPQAIPARKKKKTGINVKKMVKYTQN